MEKIMLFCLPYAGGSAMVYNRWKDHLNNKIKVMPIELAGRGKRFCDPFYKCFDEAVVDVFNQVKMVLTDSPYAFFGHSMGSLLVYETIKKIKDAGLNLPQHVFFSGRYPPHIIKREKILHTMSTANFIEEINRYGGMPKEIYENREMLSVFLPILRADYTILEQYEFRDACCQFDYDITVFTGLEDKDVTLKDLEEWKKHALRECTVYSFKGGHFFINSETKNLVQIVNKTLLKCYESSDELDIERLFEILCE
ncbi:thioesterase II family protein [Pseudobacteroides cellulosolvens]|uniref:Oleoyl-(Acyl-carrier-protein) hydrolase n=1 Tax=Pseudobacteroides cellulosolvens ATCC 35603 = DSM 2933 TaxID=398512 RepID=A0A0L6JGW1_9FIRM|nr:thioesterase domain-containing protein [Pseudobacteroides cellulosolvens]KNY24963.1 Oleoyl-(acyl-carrier-protein) hydrolase [Pseudobacteroides cellulosolvens ATCC 35603 = DSM 2933]